jgi:hypothetical protein
MRKVLPRKPPPWLLTCPLPALYIVSSGHSGKCSVWLSLELSKYSTFADKWSQNASLFVQVVKAWSNVKEEGIIKEVVIKAYVKSLKVV